MFTTSGNAFLTNDSESASCDLDPAHQSFSPSLSPQTDFDNIFRWKPIRGDKIIFFHGPPIICPSKFEIVVNIKNINLCHFLPKLHCRTLSWFWAKWKSFYFSESAFACGDNRTNCHLLSEMYVFAGEGLTAWPLGHLQEKIYLCWFLLIQMMTKLRSPMWL